MAATRIDMRSRHSPEECIRRLGDTAGDPDVPFGGFVRGDKLTLGVDRPGQRNSFAPHLTAKIEPDRGGSKITGKIAMPAGVKIFMVFWFGFLGFFMLIALGLFGIGTHEGESIWFALPFFLVPMFMVGAGVLMILFGRRMGRDHPEKLVNFLRETIDARSEGPGYTVH